jgi:hypothetical protein
MNDMTPEETPTSAAEQSPPTVAENHPVQSVKTSPRVGTAVWGAVVTVLALGMLAIGNGARFDVQLAAIAVIATAGVALLVGSLLTLRREH